MDNKLISEFKSLINIISELRKKCPWDKEQTIDTLRTLTLSEVYELSEAILNKDNIYIKDELGDLLGHILFYATIGEEKKLFSLFDIISSIKNKLIRRHPHIYGDLKITSEKEVRHNWEITKINIEGKKSIFEGLPQLLPSLLKAKIINEKYNNINKQKIDLQNILDKLINFINNLKKNKDDKIKLEKDIGEIIFLLVQIGSLYKIDADKCLEEANKKFINDIQNKSN